MAKNLLVDNVSLSPINIERSALGVQEVIWSEAAGE
jgi:hypothetical protein